MRKTRVLSMVLLLLAAVLLVSFTACGKKLSDIKDALEGENAVELTAPTGISYDGYTLSWKPVTGATEYLVTIGNGETLSLTGAAIAYENSSGESFSVSIKAKNTKKTTDATTVTFTPIETVTDVTVSDEGAISWASVNRATGYSVKVDGVEQAVAGTSYSGLTEGNHRVFVRPTVTSAEPSVIYYAKWSDEIRVNILASIAASSIHYNPETSTISWMGNRNANGYEVTVATGSNTETNTLSKDKTTFPFNANNESFRFSIRVIGDHVNTYDSIGTTEKNFVYLQPVTNIHVEDGILKWDAVDGADAYELKINGSNPVAVADTERGGFAAGRSNTVSIRPTSNEDVYFSSWSADFSFTILAAPVLQWQDLAQNGTANSNTYWDTVPEATGYVVRVTYENQDPQTYSYGATQRAFGEEPFLNAGVYKIEVKAVASTTLSNVCDSVYSKPIMVTRLAAPTAVGSGYITSDKTNVKNGFTVSFNSVGGATGYRVYKDDAALTDGATVTTAQYHATDVIGDSVITQQSFAYEIQSVGRTQQNIGGAISVVLDSLRENSLKFNITVLAAPASPTIDGFIYSYGSVSGANGYIVTDGAQPRANDGLSYSLEYLTAGNHHVQVCAAGNGGAILSSNYTPAIEVQRLDCPTDVSIGTTDGEGQLRYRAPEHTQSITVVIDNAEKGTPVSELPNMNSVIKTTGTTVYLIAEANYFDPAVATRYYMTSKGSESHRFTKLAAPTTLTVSNTEMGWNLPSNINSAEYSPSYSVYNGQDALVSGGTVNSNKYSISNLDGATQYTFKVKAIGDGTNYINSDLSDAISFYKLATPKVKVKDNAYTWNAVASATSYAVYVDGVNVSTEYHEAGGAYTFTPNFGSKVQGTATVEVYAIGNGVHSGEGIVVDSAPHSFAQKIKQLQTPVISVSYDKPAYAVDGKIVVTVTQESPYANGYVYHVGDATTGAALKETTYSMTPNSTGSFRVYVYAQGGAFDEGGIDGFYYQSSQETAVQTITLLASVAKDKMDYTTDSVLTWQPVTSANRYQLELTINGVKKDPVIVKNTRYDLGNELDIAYKDVSTLTVVIRAMGADGDSLTVTSGDTTRTWEP